MGHSADCIFSLPFLCMQAVSCFCCHGEFFAMVIFYLAWEGPGYNNLIGWVRLIHKSNSHVKWKALRAMGEFTASGNVYMLLVWVSTNMWCVNVWLHNLFLLAAKIISICLCRTVEPQKQTSWFSKSWDLWVIQSVRESQSLFTLLKLQTK